MSIEVASIDTNDEARDAYLRSAEFLDAAKFPNITFKTTEVVPKGGFLVGKVVEVELELRASAPR